VIDGFWMNMEIVPICGNTYPNGIR
jgi:hypothetical protein